MFVAGKKNHADWARTKVHALFQFIARAAPASYGLLYRATTRQFRPWIIFSLPGHWFAASSPRSATNFCPRAFPRSRTRCSDMVGCATPWKGSRPRICSFVRAPTGRDATTRGTRTRVGAGPSPIPSQAPTGRQCNSQGHRPVIYTQLCDKKRVSRAFVGTGFALGPDGAIACHVRRSESMCQGIAEEFRGSS